MLFLARHTCTVIYAVIVAIVEVVAYAAGRL